MLTKEQKQVKDILLRPIECTTQESTNVFIYHDRIFSSQEYKGYDPDMSDFAIEFYQIIYNEILDRQGYKILEGKKLKSEEFCGDTMNSYKKVTKNKSRVETRNWMNKYHCLANFWLLPKHVGHSSPHTAKLQLMKYSKSKNGINDYMDKFLHNYLENYDEYCKVFEKYTKKIAPDNYANIHFLEGSYTENKKVVDFSSKNADDIVNIMWKKIEKRADLIASKKGVELYKLFSHLGIIDE